MQKILQHLQKQIDKLSKDNKTLNDELIRQRQTHLRESRDLKKTKSSLIAVKQEVRNLKAKLATMGRRI